MPIQNILLEQYQELWISSYDNRPKSLFEGKEEDIRYCIIIGKNQKTIIHKKSFYNMI